MRHTSQTATNTNGKTYRQILPILIPCEEGEAHDGYANFLLITERVEGGTRTTSGPKVRLLKSRDFRDEAAIRKVLSPRDYDLLTGTLDLKTARETGNSLLLERANKKLNYDPKLYSYPGWANLHVPQSATPPMDPARLVLWWSGRYIPAIYCPDLRTAVFCRAFLNLQTCPHCGIVFMPEKENVIYCCPAHGHAHRMARSRHLKALREKERMEVRRRKRSR